MTTQLDAFKQKQTHISQAISQISSNFDGLKNTLSPNNLAMFNEMLESLRWVEQMLKGVNFDYGDELANQKALYVYDEIADNTLSVINQGQFLFKHIQHYPHSEKTGYDAPKWLTKTLNFSIFAEKALVVSTLLLAATPTLIVTLLPSIFTAALQFITPMMMLIPPLSIAACVLGGIILGLKITEYVLRQQSENNDELSPQETLHKNQHQAIDRLLHIKKTKTKMDRNDRHQTQQFFAHAVENTEDVEDDTWRHTHSI